MGNKAYIVNLKNDILGVRSFCLLVCFKFDTWIQGKTCLKCIANKGTIPDAPENHTFK